MGKKLTTHLVNERLKNRGIRLLDDYSHANDKLLFRGLCNHEWLATPNNIMNHNRGCPKCASNATLNKEIVNERIKGRGFTLIDEYRGSHKKSLFRCINGHEWMAISDNIVRGQGCPMCASTGFDPSKPAEIYVLNFVTFIKVGITNNLSQRRIRHRMNNGAHELIISRYYENGGDAVILEKLIKSRYIGHYVSKDICPDGFTETFPVSLTETIVDLICH